MTRQIKTGGPAFPQSETLHEDGAVLSREQHGGMTLRDWFAGQALKWAGHGDWFSQDPKSAAERAYLMADAMIAARGGDQ